jgi:hypothetical protein
MSLLRSVKSTSPPGSRSIRFITRLTRTVALVIPALAQSESVAMQKSRSRSGTLREAAIVSGLDIFCE